MKKEIRNRIKRVVAFLLVMSMIAPMLFSEKSEAAKGYKFSYSGVTVTMGSKAKKIVKAAGKPIKLKKEKSCAFKGYDRTRKYSGFILYTYTNSKKGTEFVNGITFLTSSVKTKEGIGIGSTKSDMISAYGNKYDGANGIFIYIKGKTKLCFQVKDNKVAQVKYVMK